MSVTSDRGCLTVLRGKLEGLTTTYTEKVSGHFLLYRHAEAMLEENYSKYLVGKFKSIHKTLVTCTFS